MIFLLLLIDNSRVESGGGIHGFIILIDPLVPIISITFSKFFL